MNRRHFIAALLVSAALSWAPSTLAADQTPFDLKAFEAAQAAGKPILIDVFAPWCPTCKAQAPILAQLANDPKFKSLVSFKVDFDSQKDVLRRFKVQQQSTLIVFKGKQETGRSTGDTNAASIQALLAKAL